MMFFENDRTWCSNKECKHTECYRHQANVVGKPRYLSLADFEGTKECKKGTEEKMTKDKQIEVERNEISEVLAQNFDLNGEKWSASDFEWAAHCVQMAGYRRNPTNVGDTVYWCYELLGEHLVKELIVTEITIDEDGLKIIHAKSKDGRERLFFIRNHPYYGFDVIRFTKKEAIKWEVEK